MPRSITVCANCGSRLHGKYCATCGQQARAINPTAHDFLHDLVHEFLHVDGKIFQSIWVLFSRPGFLTLELFKGRRARYVSPIRLYLIFSLLFFAIAGGRIELTGQDIADMAEAPASGWITSMTPENVSKAQEWFPRVLFVLVPMGALVVQAVVRGSGLNYPQHLFFMLHLHAAYFATEVIARPFYLVDNDTLSGIVTLIQMTYGLWYVLVAFRTAYGGGWGAVVFRSGFVVTTYMTIVVFVVIGVIFGLSASVTN